MKKTKLTRSLMAACSIVALSAVMYGCVHNGGDGPTLSELDVTGYDTAAGADVEANTYSIDDVPAALASALTGYVGPTMVDTDQSITVGDFTLTCVAGPCSITVSPDETHFTVVGTINVAAAAATVTTPPADPIIGERAAIASTIAAANTAVAAVGDAATDAQVAAANAAVTAARTAISDAGNVPAPERAANTGTVNAIATTLSNALTSRTAAIDVAEKAQAAAGLADAKSLLTAFETDIEAPVMITSVSASSGGAFKVTPTTTNVFESAAVPDTVAGHHGAMLTFDDETMVVYSSIANAEAKAVVEVFHQTGAGSNEFSVALTDEPTTIPLAALMVATDFVVTRDLEEGMVTFPGGVNGAMGTFSCTIAQDQTCADPMLEDGAVTVPGGTWTFTPNAGARTDVADTDYVYFGWWLKKATAWQVATFTGAAGYGVDGAVGMRTASALVGMSDTLAGSATYEGAAAGKFTTVGNGSGEAGHFVADAMLTVDFDADLSDTEAGNDEDGVTLSGMIDEFVANGTSRDWTVALTWNGGDPAENLGGIGDIVEDDNAVATWKNGDVTMGTGTWEADFYGTDADDNDLPMAATGEFSASVGDADIGNHIAGAFGVEKE